MPKDRMPRPVPSMMYEQGQLKSKADMFTQRTIRPERVITSVDSPSEALAVSIGEHGKVDLPYMAELLGTPGEYAQITGESVLCRLRQKIDLANTLMQHDYLKEHAPRQQ